MSTRATNNAVAAYRKVVKADRKYQQLEVKLSRLCTALTPAEFDDYARKTIAIDEAAEAVEGAGDQAFAAAVNNAGLDDSGRTR